MEKLIFKVDKGTMGSYNYIGFRKFTGKNGAIAASDGDCLLIDPGEYMELGFVGKPDISNWKNEIGEQEFYEEMCKEAYDEEDLDSRLKKQVWR